jgi:hypothetical protein
MIGAHGIVTEFNYQNQAETTGIANSDARGGSAFYNRRLSDRQYVGVTYQYLSNQAYPQNAVATSGNTQTDVQTHTISPFYTIYLSPTFSLFFSGGPQYFEETQPLSPSFHSWTYSAMTSVGWQGSHTNFVASYSRAVTESAGLLGAFDSNIANASTRWQVARTWSVDSAASYVINKNVTPLLTSFSPGGHSISGTVSIQHSMSDHLTAVLGYVRLHQSYSGIAVISSAPNSDRGFVSISYQFKRPLGH